MPKRGRKLPDVTFVHEFTDGELCRMASTLVEGLLRYDVPLRESQLAMSLVMQEAARRGLASKGVQVT